MQTAKIYRDIILHLFLKKFNELLLIHTKSRNIYKIKSYLAT